MRLPSEIRERMDGAIDNGYAVFQRKLTPTSYKIEGIRLPTLRALVKEVGEEGRAAILAATELTTFEEVLVYGFAAGYVGDATELMARIDFMLPLFDNWEHVDTITSSLKAIKKRREEFLYKYEPLKSDEAVFSRRFLAVMLLDHFMTDEYFDRIIGIYREITPGDYYVDMAVAWGLSVLLVKNFEKTFAALSGGDFTPWIRKKTAQKAIESWRISAENKARLRELKRG